MDRLTASKLQLFLQCQYWWINRGTIAESPVGDAAIRGTEIHSAIENYLLTGEIPANPEILETFLRWNEWWKTYLTTNCKRQPEVAFAYDPYTEEARYLGTSLGRDYSAATLAEIVGTADVVILDSQTVTILDWKTGSPEYVEPIETNAQLLFFSLCAGKIYRNHAIKIGVVFLGGDRVVVDQMGVSRTTIDAFEDMLCDAWQSDAQPHTGKHCRFCSYLSQCPGVGKASIELFRGRAGLDVHHSLHGPITSHSQAAWRVTMLPILRAAVDAYEKDLRRYADEHGGIQFPDGRTWGPREVTRRTPVITEESYKLLDSMGLVDAVELSTSWTAIRKIGGKNKEAELQRKFSEIGAIQEKTYTTYEVK